MRSAQSPKTTPSLVGNGRKHMFCFQKKVDEWQIYTLMVYSVFFVCFPTLSLQVSMESGISMQVVKCNEMTLNLLILQEMVNLCPSFDGLQLFVCKKRLGKMYTYIHALQLDVAVMLIFRGKIVYTDKLWGDQIPKWILSVSFKECNSLSGMVW